MAPNLTSGTFDIVSLIEGNPPVSINPTRPGFQFVYLNGPITVWVIEQVGDNTYRLRIGGYRYTGLVDNKVTATIHSEENVEWIATYREFQDAYTISPIDDDIKGWTVAYDDPNSKVAVTPIISIKTFPPQFIPTQLFRFEAVNE